MHIHNPIKKIDRGAMESSHPLLFRFCHSLIEIIGVENVRDFYNIGILATIICPILFLNILMMYAYFQCCAFQLSQCSLASLRNHPLISFLIPEDYTFHDKSSLWGIGVAFLLVIVEYKITAFWHEIGHILSGLADSHAIDFVKFSWVQPHVRIRTDGIINSSKLRIASAGTFHNILLAIICLLLYHFTKAIHFYIDSIIILIFRSGFYNYYYLNAGFVLNGLPLEQFDGNTLWLHLLEYLNLASVKRRFNISFLLVYIVVSCIQLSMLIIGMKLIPQKYIVS